MTGETTIYVQALNSYSYEGVQNYAVPDMAYMANRRAAFAWAQSARGKKAADKAREIPPVESNEMCIWWFFSW